jgi:hypothetical protein
MFDRWRKTGGMGGLADGLFEGAVDAVMGKIMAESHDVRSDVVVDAVVAVGHAAGQREDAEVSLPAGQALDLKSVQIRLHGLKVAQGRFGETTK